MDSGRLDAGGGETSDTGTTDAGDDAGINDTGANDAGDDDAGLNDAGDDDAGLNDAGLNDAGDDDAGLNDAGNDDAGLNDAGTGMPDAGDAGTPDTGTPDTGTPDAGDAGTPTNLPPVITDFYDTPSASGLVRFDWVVSDPEGGSLDCVLDLGEPGTAPVSIPGCDLTTFYSHTYARTIRYTATLTVVDAGGLSASATLLRRLATRDPLRLEISLAEGPAMAGSHLVYTFTVSNQTGQTISGAQLDFGVPTGLSFHYVTNAQPNATGCTNCQAGNQARWSLGSLAAGETRTVTVDATVAAGVVNGAQISLTASLQATGQSTITATHDVEVYNSAEAELTLSASRDPVLPGETFSLTADVGNVSGLALTGGVLTMMVPAGLSVTSAGSGGRNRQHSRRNQRELEPEFGRGGGLAVPGDRGRGRWSPRVGRHPEGPGRTHPRRRHRGRQGR